MNEAWIVAIAVIIALGLYFVVVYNALVAIRHAVSQAWSNIDVLLKQRNDELTKLVATVREHMDFEHETLVRITQARAKAETALKKNDLEGLGQAEGAIRVGLGNLFAVAEAYPELRAAESFQRLASRVTGLENAIADRREFYNDSVYRNNVKIQQFPDIVVARLLGFTPFELLEFDPVEIKDVDVSALFDSARKR
ncbi:MAG: LemA family protein [Thioalkalivibrionaceae bacterium]